jgi:RNA polymerase sigma factor for flagellar operon FliA
MTATEFQAALRKISLVGVMALDEATRGGERTDRTTLGETLADKGIGPVDTFEAKESKEALVKAISLMPDREKTVLTLYYYEGLTLSEIGEILGVTESRVCQIHTKALRQLRTKLADRSEGTPRRTTAPKGPDRTRHQRNAVNSARTQLLAS